MTSLDNWFELCFIINYYSISENIDGARLFAANVVQTLKDWNMQLNIK